MTLLITLLAAVAVTVIWYLRPGSGMKLGVLCFMYWGASLMWIVDAVFEYIREGSNFFLPSVADMINDGFLGLCAVTLGLVIWTIIVLISDPRGSIRKTLRK